MQSVLKEHSFPQRSHKQCLNLFQSVFPDSPISFLTPITSVLSCTAVALTYSPAYSLYTETFMSGNNLLQFTTMSHSLKKTHSHMRPHGFSTCHISFTPINNGLLVTQSAEVNSYNDHLCQTLRVTFVSGV